VLLLTRVIRIGAVGALIFWVLLGYVVRSDSQQPAPTTPEPAVQ
jgi:hypothetical protein